MGKSPPLSLAATSLCSHITRHELIIVLSDKYPLLHKHIHTRRYLYPYLFSLVSQLRIACKKTGKHNMMHFFTYQYSLYTRLDCHLMRRNRIRSLKISISKNRYINTHIYSNQLISNQLLILIQKVYSSLFLFLCVFIAINKRNKQYKQALYILFKRMYYC